MKNLFVALSLVVGLSLCVPTTVSAFDLTSGTTEGTRNFSPILQYQFEKEETLDFANEPEAYKKKREQKESVYLRKDGKVDVPPSVQSQFYTTKSRPGTSNLQFIKDENGKIRIQNVQ